MGKYAKLDVAVKKKKKVFEKSFIKHEYNFFLKKGWRWCSRTQLSTYGSICLCCFFEGNRERRMRPQIEKNVNKRYK